MREVLTNTSNPEEKEKQIQIFPVNLTLGYFVKTVGSCLHSWEAARRLWVQGELAPLLFHDSAKVCVVLLILHMPFITAPQCPEAKLIQLPEWAWRTLLHRKIKALVIINVIAQILSTHRHKQRQLHAGPESSFYLTISLCTLCFLNIQNPGIAKCWV